MTTYRVSTFLLLLVMVLVVGIASGKNNNAVEILGRPLTISQACAPKSRSRHTVDIDSITLSCYDEDGNIASNGDFYSDSSSSSSICSIGETGKLVVDFWLKKFTSGTMVLIDLTTMYAGRVVTIHEAKSLCLLEKMVLVEKSEKNVDDDGYMNEECSLVLGKYRTILNFEGPDFGFSDCELRFTPDFRIQFFDSSDNFKIGCADTGSTARKEIRSKESSRAQRVFITCIFILSSVLAFAFCFCYETKKTLSDIDRANRRALRRFRYKQNMRAGYIDGDGDASVASSISNASAWSRKQFT